MPLKTWMIVGALVLMTAQVNHGSLTDAPIHLIQSPKRGQFIKSTGYVLSETDAYWSGTLPSACPCRMHCQTQPQCVAFSAHPEGERVMCRFSDKGPHLSDLEDNREGQYTFLTGAIEHDIYRMEIDGFLYVIPAMKKNWADAKTFCATIPGHRLGMYHDAAQQEVILKMHVETGEQIWMDLVHSETGADWGDGISLFDTNPIAFIRLNGNVGDPLRAAFDTDFDDTATDSEKKFACQANPLRKNW